MNKPNREELKKMVEELVRSLAQKGIGVGGGAVLKFKDNGEIESIDGFGSLGNIDPEAFFGGKPTQKVPSLLPSDYKDYVRKTSKEQLEAEKAELKSALSELLTKLKGKMKEAGLPVPEFVEREAQQEEVQEEVSEDPNCTCSSCLNYDNFEEKLTKKGSNFDYAQVNLGGKLFKIKYHVSESGEENISMRDCSEDVDIKNSSTEELQLLLQEAVRDKKFDKAQTILNAIQERKNKN